MANIGFISLGCAKNQVDCERMMYRVQEAGHTVQPDVIGCDAVVINTCGFIDSAKSEAIDFILQMAQLKEQGLVGKILVTGCLSQRYQQQIMEELPEVDGVLGTGSYTQVVPAIEQLLQGNTVSDFGSIDAPEEETGRILTTPEHYAFIKIAEGCDNRCCGIDNNTVHFTVGLLNGIHNSALMVGLKLGHLDIKILCPLIQESQKIGKCLFSVNTGFTDTQHIQIRSIDYQDVHIRPSMERIVLTVASGDALLSIM